MSNFRSGISSIIRFFETYDRISSEYSPYIEPSSQASSYPSQTSSSTILGNVLMSAFYTYMSSSSSSSEEKEEKEDYHRTEPFIVVSKISSSEKECPICFEEYHNEQNNLNLNNVVITECGHLFHKTCIKEWIKEKPNCPVCRYEF
jgi:hypothetical protein